MVKAKGTQGGKRESATSEWKPTKKQLLRCVGEVCFDENGEIVVDLSKNAKSCPIELREKIASYYAKGGVVNMRLPRVEPKK